MSMTPTFTCDVVDYSTGSAPTGMQVFFKCQQSSWERNTFRGSVDSAGHVTRWIFSGSDKNLPIGSFIEHNDGRLWVLVFDTGRYYSSENISFPTVEIHFYLRKGDQMHMSLRVGPHSYTCGRSLENARITSPPTLLKSQIPPLYFPYTCFPATSSKPEVLGPLAHPSPKRLKTPHQPSRVISRHPNQILDSLSSEEKARGRPLRLIWNTFQINLLEKYFHYDPFPNGPSRSQIGNRLHAHKDHVEAWFTQRRASAEEDNYRVAIVDMSSDSSVEGANEIGSTIDDYRAATEGAQALMEFSYKGNPSRTDDFNATRHVLMERLNDFLSRATTPDQSKGHKLGGGMKRKMDNLDEDSIIVEMPIEMPEPKRPKSRPHRRRRKAISRQNS